MWIEKIFNNIQFESGHAIYVVTFGLIYSCINYTYFANGFLIYDVMDWKYINFKLFMIIFACLASAVVHFYIGRLFSNLLKKKIRSNSSKLFDNDRMISLTSTV